MNVIRERRSFLKTALAALAGAVAPAAPAPVTWAAQPNFAGVPDVGATPGHSPEQLINVPDIDAMRLITASEDALPSGLGVMVRMIRYEPSPGSSRIIERVALPWMDVRCGLYVRSTVPYRLRVDQGRDDGKLTMCIVLGQRTSVTVYRETPKWIERPAWQVVLVIGMSPALGDDRRSPAVRQGADGRTAGVAKEVRR